MWKADDRVPEINKFTRRFPSGLKKDEQWINSILSPCQSRRFQNLALFLPSGKVFGKNAPIARLAGYLNNPNTEEGGKCIKEVII